MGRWNDYTESLRGAGAFIAGEGLQESATATTVRIGEGDERRHRRPVRRDARSRSAASI